MAAVQTVTEIPTGSDATTCRIDLDINRDPQCRLKGFLGVSAETVSAMDQTVVEKYKVMSNAELFAIGEKALGDVADDIIALDEIRNRFRKGHAILGYANWQDFVQRNSKYSLRTAQRRLSEKNGKDESKVNDRYKTPVCAVEPAPESLVGKQLLGVKKEPKKVSDCEALFIRLNALVPTYSDGVEHVTVQLLESVCKLSEAGNLSNADKDFLQSIIPLLERISKDFSKYAQRLTRPQCAPSVESVEPAPKVEPQHKESLADWLQKQVRKIALQPYGHYAAKFEKYPWQHTTECANVEGSMIEIYKEIAKTATKLAGELAEKYDVPAPVVIPISGCEDLPSRRK